MALTSRDAVVAIWSKLAGVHPDRATDLLAGRAPILGELAAHDPSALLRVGERLVSSTPRTLPLSAWLEAMQADAAHLAQGARRVAMIESLISRARRTSIPGDPAVVDEAVATLRRRAKDLYFGGDLLPVRRWQTARRKPALRLNGPDLKTDSVEFAQTRVLNPDGRFSLDRRGAVFITQRLGYQRDIHERIYVDGLSPLVDEAADHFIAVRPAGGRMELLEDSLCVVDPRLLIARLVRTDGQVAM